MGLYMPTIIDRDHWKLISALRCSYVCFAPRQSTDNSTWVLDIVVIGLDMVFGGSNHEIF
jgi:hypothetical protein